MDAIMLQLQPKLEQLFVALLKPDFQAKSEYYLSNFLTHLSGKQNPELGLVLQSLPLVKEWVPKALTYWEQNQKPPIAMLGFTLNLTALLSEQESVFIEYMLSHVYTRLFTLCKITSPDKVPPTLKLAYIKVLAACLEHRQGIEWVLASEAWKRCLNFSLANETIYIIREGHGFICKLLKKSLCMDEAIVHSIVDEIMSKLRPALTTQGKAFPQIQDELLQTNLRPTVKLLVHLQSNIIEDELFKSGDYRIPKIFIDKQLEAAINKIIILTRNRDFIFELYSIIFHIYFFELFIGRKGEKFKNPDVNVLKHKILNILNSLINNSEIVNVVKLSHLSHDRWTLLNDHMPPLEQRSNNKAPFQFQNELVVFQTLPIFSVCFVHYEFNYSELENDDVRDDFFSKVVSMMSEPSLRLAYNWRNKVISQVEAFENGKLAIMHSLKSVPYFTKEGAITTFQILVYNVNDLINALKKNILSSELINKNVGYFTTLLEAIGTFIKQFDITWRESVETICVTSCTLDLLKCNFWPSRVVVEALRLVKLSIARFLSPNLALLVEEEDDSTKISLGTMLCAKLCDVEWEVRDSALEVVHTIANISNEKYPSYQKMLMDLDIVKLTVTMASSDSESFVRASAIKCLQEMIQVKSIWVQILMYEALPRKMMDILRNDSEAIVRTEAAALMRYIHEYQSFPTRQMEEIYDSMSAAVTCDLHWEVKANALDFWAKVILNHLQDQGFIDGKFPNVTFSKENRKIVTLTDTEIKSRLKKVMHKLSLNGCLGVFVSAIQDDCDLEVVKKSVRTTKKVATILDKYNLRSANFDEPQRRRLMSTPECPHTLSSSPPSMPRVDFVDDILNAIVESTDMSLLKDVYRPDLSATPPPNGMSNSRKIITPQIYVEFIQQDLDAILEEKTKWLSKMDNIGSLLDDMLKSYEDKPAEPHEDFVNTMDCY